MFIRRLGPESTLSPGGHSCPDFMLLAGGDIAVIGTDITDEAAGNFPHGCSCGPGERVVRIPKRIVQAALPHISEAL